MNILVLADYYPPYRIGGVGPIAEGIAEAYRALGHKVVVLTTGVGREGELSRGIVRGARNETWGVLGNNVRAMRLIRHEHIDLVHLHQSGTTLFLLARLLQRRFPIVLDSFQVSYLSEAREIRAIEVAGRKLRPRFREYIERFALAPAHVLLDFIGYVFADVVTTVSEDNRKEVADSYGRLVSRRLEVVANAVPPSPPKTSGFSDPQLEVRLQGKVVVAHIGVFRARKRVANLLLAFSEIAPRCPEAVLLLVGGGRGYEAAIRRLASELGIAERVEFTGSVPADRVPYYLSLVDVFCLLSSYEGMPMAMLEAMQQGKAVVATNCYGMRDLLGEKTETGGDRNLGKETSRGNCTAGVLVAVDDIRATAKALETLVTTPALRRSLGKAARRRVQDHYTWDRIARRYLELVEAEIGS